RQRKREWITTLPVILRDLAPSSGFDPQAVWRREQELDEEEQRKAAEEAASSSKKDKDSGKKAKKEKKVTVSKGAAIIEEAEKKREKKEVEVDMQRITSKKRLDLLMEILSAAVARKERSLAFDVFWAIESNKLYQEDKSKDKKDKKDKKGKDGGSPKLAEKSPHAELLSKHKAALKTVKEWRAAEDMIQCQLTVMSDRLPPLSPFTSDFRLDPWQKRVLRLIDQRKSVVISAPTSSGKTIISTYVAALGRL
ncbi:unnamed protein product, partial [Symbiodinium microadriaticum]